MISVLTLVALGIAVLTAVAVGVLWRKVRRIDGDVVGLTDQISTTENSLARQCLELRAEISVIKQMTRKQWGRSSPIIGVATESPDRARGKSTRTPPTGGNMPVPLSELAGGGDVD